MPTNNSKRGGERRLFTARDYWFEASTQGLASHMFCTNSGKQTLFRGSLVINSLSRYRFYQFRRLSFGLTVALSLFCAGRAYAQEALQLPVTQAEPTINPQFPPRELPGVRPQNELTLPIMPSPASKLPVGQPPGVAQEVGRPPPLRPQSGCELWRGTFSGNDPSVLVEARLCTDDQNQVSGDIQWSSLRSGYNIRQVVGRRDLTRRLLLHDVRFRDSRPRPGWRFCLINKYVLDPEGRDRLVGSYDSAACSDHARVDLRLSP